MNSQRVKIKVIDKVTKLPIEKARVFIYKNTGAPTIQKELYISKETNKDGIIEDKIRISKRTAISITIIKYYFEEMKVDTVEGIFTGFIIDGNGLDIIIEVMVDRLLLCSKKSSFLDKVINIFRR